MDLAHPIRSIIPSLHGAVLEILAGTEEPTSGRQIARLVEPAASHKGVTNVLNALAEAGVVTRRDVPPTALFSLNRHHIAADAVVALAGLRPQLFDELREQLRAWPVPAVGAYVFGSVARSEAGPDSDLDLLVIRPPVADETWTAQTGTLAEWFGLRTGNTLQLVDLAASELRAQRDQGAALVDEILRDHRRLVGHTLPRVLSAEAGR